MAFVLAATYWDSRGPPWPWCFYCRLSKAWFPTLWGRWTGGRCCSGPPSPEPPSLAPSCAHALYSGEMRRKKGVSKCGLRKLKRIMTNTLFMSAQLKDWLIVSLFTRGFSTIMHGFPQFGCAFQSHDGHTVKAEVRVSRLQGNILRQTKGFKATVTSINAHSIRWQALHNWPVEAPDTFYDIFIWWCVVRFDVKIRALAE